MECSENKKEEHMRDGHVTGSFVRGVVAAKDFKGASKHNLRSWSTDLAKLNP